MNIKHFNPDYYEAWYNKGLTLDASGRYKEAREAYNKWKQKC
jgi:tetratricopeptide (TPR) repeat protein